MLMAGARLWLASFTAFGQIEGRNTNISGFAKGIRRDRRVVLTMLMAGASGCWRGFAAGVGRGRLSDGGCVPDAAIGDRSFVGNGEDRHCGQRGGWSGTCWRSGFLDASVSAVAISGAQPPRRADRRRPGRWNEQLRISETIGRCSRGPLGDEHQKSLPQWLHDFDWCHLIILNLVFICCSSGSFSGRSGRLSLGTAVELGPEGSVRG